MDTEWYGYMSGHNYYCLYQYLTHYYPMQRHRDGPLTDESLNDDDVLIIKVPNRPFSATEQETIVGFVQRGGGLLLIGGRVGDGDRSWPVIATDDLERRSGQVESITERRASGESDRNARSFPRLAPVLAYAHPMPRADRRLDSGKDFRPSR